MLRKCSRHFFVFHKHFFVYFLIRSILGFLISFLCKNSISFYSLKKLTFLSSKVIKLRLISFKNQTQIPFPFVYISLTQFPLLNSQATSQKKRLLEKMKSQESSDSRSHYPSRVIVPTKQEVVAEDDCCEQSHSLTAYHHSANTPAQESVSSSNLPPFSSRYTATDKDSYQYYSKQQVQNLEGEKLIKCSSSPLRSKEASYFVLFVVLII